MVTAQGVPVCRCPEFQRFNTRAAVRRAFSLCTSCQTDSQATFSVRWSGFESNYWCESFLTADCSHLQPREGRDVTWALQWESHPERWEAHQATAAWVQTSVWCQIKHWPDSLQQEVLVKTSETTTAIQLFGQHENIGGGRKVCRSLLACSGESFSAVFCWLACEGLEEEPWKCSLSTGEPYLLLVYHWFQHTQLD